MPRKPTGNVYFSAGMWYARATIDRGKRPSFAMPWARSEEQARERLTVLAELALMLRRAGLVEPAPAYLSRAAAAEGRALDIVRRAVKDVCARGVERIAPSGGLTFRQVAEQWTSGELARRYPDHLRLVDEKTRASYGTRLSYVFDSIGDVPIDTFAIEDAERAMQELDPRHRPPTRAAVARVIMRVLALSVWPLRLIKVSPLPKGFVPSVKGTKARAYIYPDEDRQMMAKTRLPLGFRVLYGFMAREGTRSSEALALTWADLDLARGVIRLDANKTRDPRVWPLDPGVHRAFVRWKAMCAATEPSDRVFFDEDGQPLGVTNCAERFRKHLRMAGIDRAELYQSSETRHRIRLHDLRATFVTIKLAMGKSEAWISDRTGHRSSAMINVYRRAARTAGELGLGDLSPLDSAIPELRPAPPSGGEEPKGRGDEDPASNAEPMKELIKRSNLI